MPMFERIEQGIDYNTSKACSLFPRCTEPRSSLSRFCQRHRTKNWKWGSPYGRHIRPSEYQYERGVIRELIDLNREHSGIQDGLDKLEEVIDLIRKGNSVVPALRYARIKLEQDGLDPEEMLIEVAALSLVYKYPVDSPIRNRKMLCILIGRAFLKGWLIKDFRKKDNTVYERYIQPTPTERADFGRFILSKVGLICDNLADKAFEEDRQQRESTWKQNLPLTGEEDE